MSTTSSSRRRNSADAEKKTATNDAVVFAVTSTGDQGVQMYLQRVREIGAIINAAMSKLSEIDWTRESPAISEAENRLNEVMTLYCENKVSKADVKASYKTWVNAHRGGMF